MNELNLTLVVIAMMAIIVYLTRISGYLLGLRIRHIPGIKPILETLPGCAFMAILVPAVRQGTLTEILAMACVVIVMWITDNVVIATILGICILLFLGPYLQTLPIPGTVYE